MAEKLDDGALARALRSVPAWRFEKSTSAIQRGFEFADFVEAFGFMTRVALEAQAAGHHPDWSNSYNKVTIALSTHSVGGVSENDVALAKVIDALAGESSGKPEN